MARTCYLPPITREPYLP